MHNVLFYLLVSSVKQLNQMQVQQRLTPQSQHNQSEQEQHDKME